MKIKLALLIVTLFSFLLIACPFSYAQSSALQSKIDQRAADIKALEKEIAGYQKQIDALGGEASSLSAAIKSLDLTERKLAADIKLTETRVAAGALVKLSPIFTVTVPPKPLPTISTGVPPASGPLDGLTELMTGALPYT